MSLNGNKSKISLDFLGTLLAVAYGMIFIADITAYISLLFNQFVDATAKFFASYKLIATFEATTQAFCSKVDVCSCSESNTNQTMQQTNASILEIHKNLFVCFHVVIMCLGPHRIERYTFTDDVTSGQNSSCSLSTASAAPSRSTPEHSHIGGFISMRHSYA